MKKLLLITATVFFIQTSNAQQSITDIDGNVYNTVTIGTQKWMIENLRTTKFNDSTAIPEVADADAWSNLATPGICAINNTNNTDTINTYGRLYNWYAVNTGKLAPVGWHVPSYEEYETLKNYLIANGYNYDGTKTGNKIAKSLASDTGWQSSSVEGAVGNTDYTAKCNATGFTALPGGFHDPEGPFIHIGTICNLWCSTENGTNHAYHPALNYDTSNMEAYGGDMRAGLSVRCIEDPIPDTAKYFGQTPPGNEAVVFAPGIISKTDRLEIDITFSTDGKECYFGAASSFSGNFSKIYYTKFVNNTWTEQAEAPFSVNHIAGSPFLSLDGKKLYFDYSTDTSCHIWMVERTADGWGESQLLPSPINSNSMEYGYRETCNKVVYLSSDRDGDWSIWCIHPETNQAVNLGQTMNSMPYIAPDESFIIFSKSFPENDYRQYLYISFNKGNNEWSAPIDMNNSGSKVNNYNDHQVSPSLSPDGKYLFFGRHTHSGSSSDIYWVSTSIIDELKEIAFTTSVVDEAKTENLIKVFPNPSNGVFTITLESNLAKNVIAEIYNTDGKLVLKQTITNSSSTIDLSGYTAGIYVIRITADELTYNEKLIIE